MMMSDDAMEIGVATVGKGDGIRGRNKRNGALSPRSTGAHAPDHLDLVDAGETDQFLRSPIASTSTRSAIFDPFAQGKAMYRWWLNLRHHFGDGLLLQIFLVYFTQGIRSTLCSLGTSYYLKETLALAPSQAEALRGTAAIPWIVKPLYGMLSDSVPIWGTRRKSYLLIFSTFSALSYLALAVPGFVTT